MFNKKFLTVMAALLGVSLFLIGCGDPGDGAAGPQGPVYLTTSASSGAIQHAIDSGAPLVFAGVTQSDGGTVFIPAGRNVELVGAAAFTTNTTGTLVVEAATSVTGDGGLVAGGSGVIVAPATVKASGAGTVVFIQEQGDDPIDLTESVVAVRGPIQIGGAQADIAADDASLATTTLYVLGDVTVAAAIDVSALPTLLAVIGDAEVTVAQDQAVIWEISGDLDAKKLPTDGAGSLSVKGNANFAEAVTTITGAIDIGGDATFAAALTSSTGTFNVDGGLSVGGIFTVGSGNATVGGNLAVSGTFAVSLGGDLTVGGTATLGGAFGNDSTAAVATFNGVTTIAGAVTSDTGGLTIAGTGTVALSSNTAVTLTANMTVKNTGGVTVAGAIDLSTALKATGVTVKGESGTGVVMGTDSHTAITLPATTSITVPVGGSVVAGDETGKVTILGGAVLKAGTYTATDVKTATLTLGANAVLEVQDGGSIAISAASPDEGQIVLADNTSKIFLLAGGSFAAGAKGTIIKNGGTMTGVTLTVGTTDKPGVATKAVVSTAGTVFTVTTEATTGVTGDVIVGVIKWVTGTDPVSAKAGVDPTTGAAAGSIKAGAGTTLTISTTS